MATKQAKQLEEVRQAIQDLKDERGQLQAAPASRDEAVQALDAWLDRKQRAFDDRGEGAAASFVKKKPEAKLGQAYPGSGGETSYDEAIIALFPDAVRSYYISAIDAHLGDRQPLRTEDRKVREAEIERELVELERQEEDLVQAIPGAARRADADPRGFLGLDAPPAPPAPGQDEDEGAPDHPLGSHVDYGNRDGEAV